MTTTNHKTLTAATPATCLVLSLYLSFLFACVGTDIDVGNGIELTQSTKRTWDPDGNATRRYTGWTVSNFLVARYASNLRMVITDDVTHHHRQYQLLRHQWIVEISVSNVVGLDILHVTVQGKRRKKRTSNRHCWEMASNLARIAEE